MTQLAPPIPPAIRSMTRRTGLGRHGRIEDSAGDPLDGLVNLFDIGIVLAVAFLIAGLGLTLDQHTHRLQTAHVEQHRIPRHCPRRHPVRLLPAATGGPSALFTGFSNGQLVYVQQNPRR